MAEGRNRQLWQHTSEILALLANCHSTKRKYKASDFNPTIERGRLPASPRDVAEMIARKR